MQSTNSEYGLHLFLFLTLVAYSNSIPRIANAPDDAISLAFLQTTSDMLHLEQFLNI